MNPLPEILTSLPIGPLRPQFEQAFARRPIVLTAPTGSGKSTCVPLWIDADVIIVEPRRVACRSLARFVCSALGCSLGSEVGYVVRHENVTSKSTRVLYVTPGVALQMLEGLRPDTAVLLDEYHERSIELDLLLAILQQRQHQRLGVLSATIDGDRIARHLDATLLQGQGRCHSVDIQHVGDQLQPDARRLAERVAEALDVLGPLDGDVLVFLPGKAEIGACTRQLQKQSEVLPLHAGLTPSQQDRAFELSESPRVILSTNLAETSVTLPRVTAVIDTGLVRRTVYREGRGALSIAAITQDAADQRAGRAGRLQPGRCLRMWHRDGRLATRTPPEIHREDLSSLVLASLHHGHDPAVLPWLDPPRDYALVEAHDVLSQLEIIDPSGKLTPMGKEVATLPVDPVLARLLVAGKAHAALGDTIQLVAALSLDRPLFRPGEPAEPETPTAEPDPLTEARCDATAAILAVRQGDRHKPRLRPGALAEARRIAEQLRQLFGVKLPAADAPVDRDQLARVVFAALPRCAYARRKRRLHAWGNGHNEVLLGRACLVDDKIATILVVDQRFAVERGRVLKRLATCCMPVTIDQLRRLGAGQQEVLSARVEKTRDGSGRLWVQLAWRIGTRELSRSEEIPRGARATEALLRVLTNGLLFAEQIAAARRQIDAHNLQASLDRDRSIATFDAWLRDRVASLGFDSGEDLPLLTAADFDPALLSPEELARVDEAFPAVLDLGSGKLTITYNVAARRVTLQGRQPPRLDFLPRWSGWSVRFTDGKRSVVLKT